MPTKCVLKSAEKSAPGEQTDSLSGTERKEKQVLQHNSVNGTWEDGLKPLRILSEDEVKHQDSFCCG